MRRALLTGATGGIGRRILAALRADGFEVAALGRTPAHDVAFFAADVAEAAQVERAVAQAVDELGGLDAVVCAHGVDEANAPVGEHPLGAWDRTVAVNLSGCFYVCRAALERLADGGAIVLVTSVAGARAWPGDAAYVAAKAGVERLAQNIAVEYGGRGVRANCVAPGIIDAGMTDVIAGAERSRAARLAPLGRLGTADEVAAAVAWLLSDAAAFVTGATLAVDGGYLAAPPGRVPGWRPLS